MAEEISCERQGIRVKQPTIETSRWFSHTCRGMVDLKKHLLKNGFSYVCLSHFSNDPVEKISGKFCQCSRGTYFINDHNVLQKAATQKTTLCLDLSVSFDEESLSSDHSCEKYCFFM